MKLIKPSFKILYQPVGIDTYYYPIEWAGRTCYKSTRKDGSSVIDFAERMIKSGHLSVLEHGTVFLDFHDLEPFDKSWLIDFYRNNPYSQVCGSYVTTNYRVIVENKDNGIGKESLKAISKQTMYHPRRWMVKFIVDRGTSHQLVRHRKFSFCQESTRYCNYNNTNKFGDDITFIIPHHLESVISDNTIIKDDNITVPADATVFLKSLLAAENNYKELTGTYNWKPEEARQVLPNALKTELIMTGFESDWKEFFKLRSSIAKTGKPHPDLVRLTDSLMHIMLKTNMINYSHDQ